MAQLNLVDPMLAAFYSALGPFFSKLRCNPDKQATTDSSAVVSQYLSPQSCVACEFEPSLLQYAFNVSCLVANIILNSVSIKHTLLSMKDNGAFMSAVLTFVCNFLFATAFDYLLEGKAMSFERWVGGGLVVLGVVCLRGVDRQAVEVSDAGEKRDSQNAKEK